MPNIDFHYAESAVYSPCNLSFSKRGIAAQAEPNVPGLVFADLDLDLMQKSRSEGTVTPRTNRREDLFVFQQGSVKVKHV